MHGDCGCKLGRVTMAAALVSFLITCGLPVQVVASEVSKSSGRPVACVFDGGHLSEFEGLRAFVQRSAEKVAVGSGMDRAATAAHVEKLLQELESSHLFIIDEVTEARDRADGKATFANREVPKYIVCREAIRDRSGKVDEKHTQSASLLITLRSVSPMLDPNDENDKGFILEVEVSEFVKGTDREKPEKAWTANSTKKVTLRAVDGSRAMPLASTDKSE